MRRQSSRYLVALTLVLALACLGATVGCKQTSDPKEKKGSSTSSQQTFAVPASFTVKVTGEGASKVYTSAELDKLAKSSAVYTSVNNWPTNKEYAASGVSLDELIKLTGVSPKTVTFSGADGFSVSLTAQQLAAKRYTFANGKKTEVPTILAYRFGEGSSLSDMTQTKKGFTLVFGQQVKDEHTNPAFVEDIETIELSTSEGQWAPPTIFPTSMTVVQGGTVKLLHPDSGLLKIYYTTDGSDPDLSSTMYNPSTYQPELNKPIPIDANTTIKARAIGYGKTDSEIATFEVKVK